MKKLIFSGLIALLFAQTVFAQYATERSGYEGDFFSLEGALELFQNAQTLRGFERKLNTRNNWVNNLDLDYDGRTDYIRVEHRRQGDFHLVILQAIVGPYDIQDVAVIEIERIRRGDAILQIIGDEDLYGREVFVEPIIGYANSRTRNHVNYGEYVNVYHWPIVQYLFGPQYRQVYVSPYRYQYYPSWWSAWRPVSWTVFRPRVVVYTRRFCIAPRLRVVRAHRYYRPLRVYSYEVVLRSNRVRVSQGRSPISRPRYANVDQRGRPGNDFRDKPNRLSSDRKQAAVRRLPNNSRTSPRDQITRRQLSSPAHRPGFRKTADQEWKKEKEFRPNQRTTSPRLKEKRSEQNQRAVPFRSTRPKPDHRMSKPSKGSSPAYKSPQRGSREKARQSYKTRNTRTPTSRSTNQNGHHIGKKAGGAKSRALSSGPERSSTKPRKN